MLTTIYIIAGFIFAVVVIALIWRLSSTRQSIPCPSWLGWMVEMDNPVLKNNSAREITRHLELRPGMKVLDFGCGPGRLTLPIARLIGPSGIVTAFDIQDGMLERVRTKANLENLSNIEYVQGAAGEGKLGKSAFHRALLVTVLGEIPDQQIALKELFECLKPGGILSITEVIADPHFQTRRKVLEVAKSVGFEEKDSWGSQISYTINFEKH